MDEQRELRYSVRVAWSEEDAAFVAVSPEFEGISALGATYGEAVAEVEAALLMAVETHEEESWAVPEPVHEPRHSGQFRLRLPRSLHAWLADRAHQEGVSLNTLVVDFLSQARGTTNATDRAAGRLEASLRRLDSVIAGSQLVPTGGGEGREG